MTTYSEAYRRRHRKLGLCDDCPRKVRPGHRHCPRCARRSAAKYHAMKNELTRLRRKVRAIVP